MDRYSHNIPSLHPPENPTASLAHRGRTAPPIIENHVMDSVNLIQAIQEEEYLKKYKEANLPISDQELLNAAIRKEAILIQHMNAQYPLITEPAWFQAFRLNEFHNIQTELKEIKNALSKNWNHSSGDGVTSPWQVLNFIDNSNPIVDHGLPALENVNDLNLLNGNQLTQYLQGYGIENVPARILERRVVLGRVIGYYGSLNA